MLFADLINEVVKLPQEQWMSHIQSFSLETLAAAAGLEFPFSDADLEIFVRNLNEEAKQDVHGEQDDAVRRRLFVRSALCAEMIIKFKEIPYVYNKPTLEEESAYQEEVVFEKEFMEDVRARANLRSAAILERCKDQGPVARADAIKEINEMERITSFNPFKESRQFRFGLYENRPIPTEEDKQEFIALMENSNLFR